MPADVAELKRRVAAEKLSNSSANRHLATLRSLFNLARRWGLVETLNPAASPGMLPERGRDRYLTPVQTRALVKALELEPGRDAAAALVLLIVTGARKREVLHATWDLEIGAILGHRQLSTTTRHARHAPERLVETASVAARAWNLMLAVPDDMAVG